MRARLNAFRCFRAVVTTAMLGLAVGAASPVSAQSTAFTYQGSLDDGGVPASGLHDFRVLLFNAASGGLVIAPPQCADNVDVIDGVFTLQLDFGQAYATTAERHMQIEVRRDTGLTCSNLAGFVIMAPRQQLTATPMASHAKSAFALDAADGSPTNAVFVNNAGQVGVGTTSPAALLHLQGTAPVMLLQDTASPSDQAGYVSFRNSASTETGWIGYGSTGSPQFSIYNARTDGDLRLYTGTGGDINLTPGSGGDVNLVGGNVGVGTYTPAAKLDVRGDIKLGLAGEFHATSGGERLHIVRGQVGDDGLPDLGTGFTAVRNSTGRYTILFDPAFSSNPVVTVTGLSSGFGTSQLVATIDEVPTGTSVAVTLTKLDGSLINTAFHFIAIGPR